MLRNNDIFYISVCLTIMALIGCSKWDLGEKIKMKNTIALLSDKNHCDDAYKKIMSMGKKVIPLLIENAPNNSIYEGTIIEDYTSSYYIARPTVGVVSLYLVEAILKNRVRPHLAPLIVSKKDKFPFKEEGSKFAYTKDSNLKKAQLYYRLWWKKVKGKSLEETRKVLPLDNTDLKWFGTVDGTK